MAHLYDPTAPHHCAQCADYTHTIKRTTPPTADELVHASRYFPAVLICEGIRVPVHITELVDVAPPDGTIHRFQGRFELTGVPTWARKELP
jgi:hypothetical protein